MNPVTDWSQLPITLDAHQVAAVYGFKSWRTACRKIGTREIAQPFADRPHRWRKSDVKAHYERLTLHGTRRARLAVAS
jgi:hypothetical protein